MATDVKEPSFHHRSHSFYPEKEAVPVICLQGQHLSQTPDTPEDVGKPPSALAYKRRSEQVNDMLFHHSISSTLQRRIRERKAQFSPLTKPKPLPIEQTAMPRRKSAKTGISQAEKAIESEYLEANMGRYLETGYGFAGGPLYKGHPNSNPTAGYERYAARLEPVPHVPALFMRTGNALSPPPLSPPECVQGSAGGPPSPSSSPPNKQGPLRPSARGPRALPNGVPDACIRHLADLALTGSAAKMKGVQRFHAAANHEAFISQANERYLSEMINTLATNSFNEQRDSAAGLQPGERVLDRAFCRSVIEELEKIAIANAEKMQGHLNANLPPILSTMGVKGTL